MWNLSYYFSIFYLSLLKRFLKSCNSLCFRTYYSFPQHLLLFVRGSFYLFVFVTIFPWICLFLSLFVLVSLSLSVSICPWNRRFLSLFVPGTVGFCLSLSMSLSLSRLSLYLSGSGSVCPCICLSLSLFVSNSVCPWICPSLYLFVLGSFCLCICLALSLSRSVELFYFHFILQLNYLYFGRIINSLVCNKANKTEVGTLWWHSHNKFLTLGTEEMLDFILKL